MHGIKTLSFKWNRGTSFFFIFSSQVLILDTKLPPCWTLTSDLDIVFPRIHLYDAARYPVFPRSLSKRLIFPNFSGVCLRTPVAFLHQSACKHVIPVRSPFFRDSPDWNILPHPFIVFFIFFFVLFTCVSDVRGIPVDDGSPKIYSRQLHLWQLIISSKSSSDVSFP